MTVQLGLDLRALPTNTSASHVDLFVLSQGDKLRDDAPAGVDVEIRHIPGAGILYATFRAATRNDARAACEHAVAAYMVHPPRLPVMPARGVATSAAQVVVPCSDGLAR